jgi:transcription elongation factor GreB
MSKAFLKDDDATEELEVEPQQAAPAGTKNYISPAGYARLDAERRHLVEVERPEVVRTVSWAASNGDRSENGDYIYGKRRLREIDRRVRYLIKRLENAEIVRSAGRDTDQIFFGASVTLRAAGGDEREVTIVGMDEVEPARGRVSWISPIARALLKAREGDVVRVAAPAGVEELEIVHVEYRAID